MSPSFTGEVHDCETTRPSITVSDILQMTPLDVTLDKPVALEHKESFQALETRVRDPFIARGVVSTRDQHVWHLRMTPLDVTL